jgi:MFS family permease
VATFLAALSRGGLMFMLILWLQGIWLPLHGYGFEDTPLWAGIYMLPLSVGFLVAGPISGRLADHFGARPFATGGMIASAIGFLLLIALPINFTYWEFGLVIFLIGAAMGLFAAPNLTGIMNSLPPDQRGSGAGMAATFQNSASVLSIGVFFSLIIVGLSSTLPAVLFHGLALHGVPHAAAEQVSKLPPVGSLFASFLGYNPVGTLLAPTLPHTRRPRPTSPATSSSRRSSRIRSRPGSTPSSTSLRGAAWWRRSPPGCAVGSTTTRRTWPRSKRPSCSKSPELR